MKYLTIFLRTSVILAGLIAYCFCPAQAQTKGEATFTLTDGTVYENASFKVNHKFLTVQVRSEGVTRNISFIDIESIVNNEGKDIKRSVLRGDYRERITERPEPGENLVQPAVEQHPPDPAVASNESKSALWKQVVHVSGNLCFPQGNYYTGIGAGPGFDVEVEFPLARKIGLRASVIYSTSKIDDELVLIAASDYSGEYFFYNFDFKATRYYLLLTYYPNPELLTSGNVSVCAQVGLGLVKGVLSADYVSLDKSDDEAVLRHEDTETHVTVRALGVDAMYLISDRIAVRLGTAYNRDFIKDAEAYQFDLRAGVTAMFR